MHKVGDTVWVFDRNRRVYKRDEVGRSTDGPIFREHFRPTIISGETSRSWVLSGGLKVSKTGVAVRKCGGWPGGIVAVYMTQEAVEAAVFLNDHPRKIARAVESCTDVAVLRQVAALVGYKEES